MNPSKKANSRRKRDSGWATITLLSKEPLNVKVKFLNKKMRGHDEVSQSLSHVFLRIFFHFSKARQLLIMVAVANLGLGVWNKFNVICAANHAGNIEMWKGERIIIIIKTSSAFICPGWNRIKWSSVMIFGRRQNDNGKENVIKWSFFFRALHCFHFWSGLPDRAITQL